MSKYASRKFWVDTFDRVVASAAQGFIAAAGLDSSGLLDIDWQGVLSVTGSMALLALVSSVAFRGKGEDPPPLPQLPDSWGQTDADADQAPAPQVATSSVDPIDDEVDAPDTAEAAQPSEYPSRRDLRTDDSAEPGDRW